MVIFRRRPLGAFSMIALLVALLFITPIAAVVVSIFGPSTGTWSHLAATVLPDYIVNTLWLLAGVAAGVVLLGVGAAWLVSMCRFPGSGVFEWLLVLPLAMPAYVIAYAYTDLLQFAGPVQAALREATGWRVREYWFPEIRSLGGAIAMFSLVLYPYVYLLARAAFLEMPASAFEAGRTLGYGAWRGFFRLALPLARPGIAAGAALALMETLADFGTVSYFAVQTFTTGIYRAWLSLGDPVAAAQLATLMLAFVAAILLLERANRGGSRFYNPGRRSRVSPYQLNGASAWVAVCACAVPVLFGFVLPAWILARMAFSEGDAHFFSSRMLGLVANSFTLAAVTAAAAIFLAVIMAYAARIDRGILVAAAHRIAGLGYAIPGAVIAVGILVPVARLDNLIDAWMTDVFGKGPGLLLTGSIVALVYAYLVRFLAVALQTVEAGLSKVTPSMDDAARGLGFSPARTLFKVHVPIIRGSVVTAGLLVFVDVMKELPATFIMRPFNFDTLAVQAYNFASDERLAEAATASLVIVAVGLLPLFILCRAIAAGGRKER
jgi:iron(III) transport system permease protein